MSRMKSWRGDDVEQALMTASLAAHLCDPKRETSNAGIESVGDDFLRGEKDDDVESKESGPRGWGEGGGWKRGTTQNTHFQVPVPKRVIEEKWGKEEEEEEEDSPSSQPPRRTRPFSPVITLYLPAPPPHLLPTPVPHPELPRLVCRQHLVQQTVQGPEVEFSGFPLLGPRFRISLLP